MKKRRVLKKWVRYSLTGVMVITILVGLLNINGKMEQDFVENCESQGYSTNYCIAHS